VFAMAFAVARSVGGCCGFPRPMCSFLQKPPADLSTGAEMFLASARAFPPTAINGLLCKHLSILISTESVAAPCQVSIDLAVSVSGFSCQLWLVGHFWLHSFVFRAAAGFWLWFSQTVGFLYRLLSNTFGKSRFFRTASNQHCSGSAGFRVLHRFLTTASNQHCSGSAVPHFPMEDKVSVFRTVSRELELDLSSIAVSLRVRSPFHGRPVALTAAILLVSTLSLPGAGSAHGARDNA